MSTLKRTDRIAQLEDKLRQLKERQQAVEARQRTLESRRKRKDDTRRKILVGAIVLAKVEQGELDPGQLRRWLDQALTRVDIGVCFNSTKALLTKARDQRDGVHHASPEQ